ncbi:MAG: phosphoserine phosphatase SerB [Actinomycetaceae bacterium]|nr:phosphoserine phosphatase SerB [Actinomycetaceae bacterium]
MPPAFFAAPPPLVITDVDSTLISQEVIEELAHHAGSRNEVAAITARAMNGELDFAQSLHARVATLKGLPLSIFERVVDAVTPTVGAQLLIDEIHRHGGHFGVVSGGFEEVVGPLCQRMGIDHYVANRLEVSNGELTGRVLGDVVTAETKVEKVHEWAGLHGTDAAHVLAIGDGANDVPMLKTAGLGVAFCAKPAVREDISAHLNIARLDAVRACWA